LDVVPKAAKALLMAQKQIYYVFEVINVKVLIDR
jgi:hypothetical protein